MHRSPQPCEPNKEPIEGRFRKMWVSRVGWGGVGAIWPIQRRGWGKIGPGDRVLHKKLSLCLCDHLQLYGVTVTHMTMTKFPFYILIRYICICGSSPFVFVNQILLYLLITTFYISQPSPFVFLEQFFLYLWPVATLATASVTEKTLLTLAGERTMPNI